MFISSFLLKNVLMISLLSRFKKRWANNAWNRRNSFPIWNLNPKSLIIVSLPETIFCSSLCFDSLCQMYTINIYDTSSVVDKSLSKSSSLDDNNMCIMCSKAKHFLLNIIPSMTLKRDCILRHLRQDSSLQDTRSYNTCEKQFHNSFR